MYEYGAPKQKYAEQCRLKRTNDTPPVGWLVAVYIFVYVWNVWKLQTDGVSLLDNFAYEHFPNFIWNFP